MADQCLWLVVAVFFLCTTLGVALNTDVNISDNLASARAASQSTQEAGRIYNRTGIGACLVCLLIAASRADWFSRAMRVSKSPIVWAVGYQGIIAWHYLSDGDMWDFARLCGVWALLMVAMSASPPMTLDNYVSKTARLFRLLLWLSLTIGVVLPSHGWDHNYSESFLPGIQDRFSGVGGHPNSMGAIAGIAVLMELDQLSGHGTKRWLSVLHLALATALLLLTQSKTALVACAICGAYLMSNRKSRLLPRGVRAVVVASAVLTGSVVAWATFSEWAVSNKESLEGLTGRVPLWKYYWELGLDRPWFGHGPSLWAELLGRTSFEYGWAAGNAHNQLLNSFLLAGLFGVGCLVAYVAALFRSRRRIDIQHRVVFTACLLFMVIRSLAEAGFEPGDLSVVAMIQIVLIGFCLCQRTPRRHGRDSGMRIVLRVPSPISAVQPSQQ